MTVRSELDAKLLEIAREALPGSRRVALLEHESDPFAKRSSESFQPAASALRLELSVVRVTQADELGRAFVEASQRKADAMFSPLLTLFTIHAQRIAELAMNARLPLFSAFRGSTVLGGLVSYYGDTSENYRRVAVLADKILKGAKPEDLPIGQPDRFFLVINLRIAKALGIKILQSIRLRADGVIG